MCGLVGIYSSNMLMRHKDCFKLLLFLDTLRGRDSTGVAALRHNADTEIMKSTVPGYEFIDPPAFDRFLQLNDFCWIGHNRHGTVGKNIRSNAHPFTILDKDGSCLIVGAHNGTLKNKYDLRDHLKFGTDSEALFHNIAHHGIEETMPKVDGAWAISYYDHAEEELRFLRNSERTLYYAYEDDHKTLIWASEIWMIRVAASRHNITLEEDKVYAFAENTLYKFPVPLKITDKLTVERQGGLVGKETPAFFRDGWYQNRANLQSPKKEASSTGMAEGTTLVERALAARQEQMRLKSSTTEHNHTENQPPKKDGQSNKQSSNDTNNIIPIGSGKLYKGYQGVKLTKKEIEDQLENGCSWCELEFITLDDRFAWLEEGKPICYKCLIGEAEPLKTAKKTVH